MPGHELILSATVALVLSFVPARGGDAGFVRRLLATGEGHIAYEVRAAPGPPLILIHGSFGDNRDWDNTVCRLDPQLKLLLVELRGHGMSWPPPANGSIEQFAQDVLRVAAAEKCDRFYVGGHSIGGMIALEIGRVRPESVKGILSIEGWTHHRVPAEAFQNLLRNTLTPEQEARRVASRDRSTGRWTEEQKKEFGQIWHHWDGSAFLRSTRLPILELYGDRGGPPPPAALLGIPQRPNIRVRWIAGASHWLLLEKPARVADEITDFIRRVESAAEAQSSPAL